MRCLHSIPDCRSIVTSFVLVRWLCFTLTLSAVLTGCGWLEVKHRGWIYRPTPGTLSDWEPIAANEQAFFIDVPAVDHGGAPIKLRALWIPQGNPSAPAVFYLHGTFRNVYQNRSKILAIHDAGLAVMAVEYRGWGDSTAIVPSEQSIVADAEAGWSAFVERASDPRRRILFGHSLGAAVAVDLASRRAVPHDYAALVLESPFKSLPDIARDYGTLSRMIAPLTTQRFDSFARMPGIGGPKWFVTGNVDDTIPTAHAVDLYEAAGDPRWLVVLEQGGHSRLHIQFPRTYRALWQCIARSLDETLDTAATQACMSALPDEIAAPDR